MASFFLLLPNCLLLGGIIVDTKDNSHPLHFSISMQKYYIKEVGFFSGSVATF